MSEDGSGEVSPGNPDEAHGVKQFALLFQRRFGPLFLTQFLGAFNDNLFKTALIVLIVFEAAPQDVNFFTNLAAALFIIPFFFFASAAGQLSDKYDKARIIRLTKGAEIGVMGLAALTWGGGYSLPLMAILFLMGVQSAFFSPSKYAILPQHLHESELLGGNAQIEMSTFVAILLGTILGGLLATGSLQVWIAPTIITVSVLGFLSSLAIPQAPSLVQELEVDWNPLRAAFRLFSFARRHHYRVLLSILGISWFWLFGAVFLTQIPNYVVSELYGGREVVTALLASFTLGIGLGALLCDRLSGHKIEIGLVPFGSIGMSLFAAHLSFLTVPLADTPYELASFLDAGGTLVLVDLLGMTVFGGFFIVPLYAFVQQQSPPDKRARIVALNNILNALFMVVASLLGVLMLQVAGMSIGGLFLTLALMNVAVSVFVFKQVPLFAARFLIWLVSRTLFRIHAVGLQNIPQAGGALIVARQAGLMQILIVASAARRPIRFVVEPEVYTSAAMRFVLQTLEAIPVMSRSSDDTQKGPEKAVARALRKGELVCMVAGRKDQQSPVHRLIQSATNYSEIRGNLPQIRIEIRSLSQRPTTPPPAPPAESLPLFSRVELRVGTTVK